VPEPDCAVGFDVCISSFCGKVAGELILRARLDHQIEHHGLEPWDVDAHYEDERRLYEIVAGANSKWCYNRRFFRSAQGRFGWGLDGIRQGDVVAVLYGAQHGLVLREVVGDADGEKRRYRIVGDCYLHGVMEGEAFEDDSGYQDAEFVLV